MHARVPNRGVVIEDGRADAAASVPGRKVRIQRPSVSGALRNCIQTEFFAQKVRDSREEYFHLLLFVRVCVFYVASLFARSGFEQFSVQIHLR